MNDVIKSLTEIEAKAGSAVQKIEEDKRNLLGKINDKSERVISGLKDDFNQKAESIRIKAEKEFQAKSAFYEEVFIKELEKLKTEYDENHSIWEDEIFNRIVSDH